MAKAVILHVLGDGIGWGKTDNPAAVALVSLTDGGDRKALNGAGLAVDDRQPGIAGDVAKGAGLLAGNPIIARLV